MDCRIHPIFHVSLLKRLKEDQVTIHDLQINLDRETTMIEPENLFTTLLCHPQWTGKRIITSTMEGWSS